MSALSKIETDLALQSMARRLGVPVMSIQSALSEAGVVLAPMPSARILPMRRDDARPCDVEV